MIVREHFPAENPYQGEIRSGKGSSSGIPKQGLLPVADHGKDDK